MRRGFTLVEVLASLAILATALLLFALGESTARRTVQRQVSLLDARADSWNIMQALAADAGRALEVVETRPASSPARDGAVVILRVPALDESGNNLPGESDEIAYLTTAPDEQGMFSIRRLSTPSGNSHRAANSTMLTRRAFEFRITHETERGASGALSLHLGIRSATPQIKNSPPAVIDAILPMGKPIVEGDQ